MKAVIIVKPEVRTIVVRVLLMDEEVGVAWNTEISTSINGPTPKSMVSVGVSFDI